MYSSQAADPSLYFLKLLAHNIRWGLLRALARSDQRVNELVALTRRPPNLISYHLRRLRDHHLVIHHRSAADARDIYYSIDLDTLRKLYLDSGQSLHPALVAELDDQPQSQPNSRPVKSVRVLFLCTHNSARSQIAEAILRHHSQGQVEAFSAGSEPTEIHPLAVQVLTEIGIDASRQRSKHLNEFTHQSFDYVITVCDRVRESCPVFPGDPDKIHWSFPDPVAVAGSAQKRERAFRETATQLTTRINYLLLMIDRAHREKGTK